MWWLREIPEQENLAQYAYTYFDNAFTNEELDSLINLIYKTEQIEKATTFNDAGSDIRASNIAWLQPRPEYDFLYRKLTDIVNQVNNEYWRINLSFLEDLQFTEYSHLYEGHYNWHCDNFMCPVASNNIRKLSFAMLLNDREEFEGGDFEIKVTSEQLIVPQKRGRIIFFTSPTLHKVNKVTSGTRLSLVGWVHGPNWV